MLRDSVIQRFEFTIELFWKTLRALLQLPSDAGSKTVLQEAYRNGWIDDEATWVPLVQERNRTSHEYDELQAMELADKIDELYLSALQNARENLKKKMLKQDSISGDSKLKE
jgi:nucleotidyltransferase substrate binding protein (TIGR01987 family)